MTLAERLLLAELAPVDLATVMTVAPNFILKDLVFRFKFSLS